MIVCHKATDEPVVQGFGCSGDGVFGVVFLGGLEFLLQTGKDVSQSF